VKLGISDEKSQNKNFKSETDLSYSYTEYGKASLKIEVDSNPLEPTEEFKKDVEKAIVSGDPKGRFKKIIEDYGQFIPTEIILGGRAYYKGQKVINETFKEETKGISMSSVFNFLKVKFGNTSQHSSKKYKYIYDKSEKLIGGQQPEGVFDEAAWGRSLQDYENCDCIEFKVPISIFQFLDKKLRK